MNFDGSINAVRSAATCTQNRRIDSLTASECCSRKISSSVPTALSRCTHSFSAPLNCSHVTRFLRCFRCHVGTDRTCSVPNARRTNERQENATLRTSDNSFAQTRVCTSSVNSAARSRLLTRTFPVCWARRRRRRFGEEQMSLRACGRALRFALSSSAFLLTKRGCGSSCGLGFQDAWKSSSGFQQCPWSRQSQRLYHAVHGTGQSAESATSDPGSGPAEAIEVTFILADGSEKTVRAKIGATVLEVAHDNGVDLEGACGGCCSCSTCHIILEQHVYCQLPEPSEEEEDMLDLAACLTPTSRLGCQVRVSKQLSQAKIRLPVMTRNFYVDGHVPAPH
ncbi:adrenodoxin-type ferredoxin [Cystoisospora suis]|uniref:Adrenodoxin-type ferredoxin n=1 Tax=Cystoisospora suis TaxID=483139 RepID=A0A2C6L807_9APIC|nr:adrenodoxin-type ferredoxin [Cystoisospora suis]